METAIQKNKPTLNPALIEIANEAEALLASKIESFKDLRIQSLNDKEGYLKVSSARKELKSIRINIEKAFKDDRDKLNVFVKANSLKEKELVAKISPIENMLYEQEKAVDEEKERIRMDAVRLERELIQRKIDAFSKYNYAIDFGVVVQMTDAQYESELSRVKILYEAEQIAEQQRLAEVERLKKEEEERIAMVKAEQEAEAKRLAEEAKKLNDEKQRIEKEQKDREDAIKEAQAKVDADKKAIEDARKKAVEEEERKVREEKIRKDAEQKAKADLEIKLKLEQEKREKAEQIAKVKAEKKELLRPDKEKLIDFADNIIFNTAIPVVKSEEGKDICRKAKEMFEEIVSYVRKEADKL